ncbi:MAG: ABC transporter ATP-binding protein [bacterium]|nr:ABC transporter ATP-binding protein [bacterium]
MRPLLRILAFTRELSPYYLGIVLASLVATALGLAVPFIIGRATDVVVETIGGTRTVEAGVSAVIWLAIALLIAELASTAASSIGGYWGDVMSARMRSILSTRYFTKLLSLPQRYFDDELTGTIISRLNRSITEVTNFIKAFSNSFFTMLLTTFAVLVISAWYAWPLTLLIAIVFPLYMWLTALTSSHWQKIEGKKNAEVDEASGRFSEVIGQIRVVKSFVQERRELDAFSARFENTIDHTRRQSVHWHGMDAARRAVLNGIFFGIYAIIFVMTARGSFTVGDMVLLIQLMNMAKQPVFAMSWLVDSAQRAAAGSRDYFSVMELESVEEVVAAGAAEHAARGMDLTLSARGQSVPAVAFHGVTFAYEPGGPAVLEDVTFAIEQGERVAFVGESGGGKTTIVNLLLGLYPLRSGRIELFGHDITGLSRPELRRQIGVVFQDPALFSGSIRENITYARPLAEEAAVVGAARKANADEFVGKFAKGYESHIGERGLKLSGGQKQRISIARAIVKDAPILVLDEATSSLDTRSERLVQEGLESLMADRTSLIIAHRLSTISSVDRIVTLRDGRVDEIGSPDELAASGGIYAELLSLQLSGTQADKKRLKRFEIEG